jgi:hypothetical protein
MNVLCVMMMMKGENSLSEFSVTMSRYLHYTNPIRGSLAPTKTWACKFLKIFHNASAIRNPRSFVKLRERVDINFIITDHNGFTSADGDILGYSFKTEVLYY